ncbi:recombinase family protein [Vibrio mediterranei]|uniref:Site-specific recombinase n=1 Tax=Vibrio mediterranei TaxID=689 RepID=A0ABX5DLY9_9VIBR|nr:recombinase family protein [Vibrio mediterranei]PCD90195.1 site-specific recombinase [Vibrio mediterranei]PRQ69581.1 site-specific recombinase [Vibrio mediterranei]
MKIRAYLRASTSEQNAERAKEYVRNFAESQGHVIEKFYVEQASGRIYERPELNRLIEDSIAGDVLLVEQVDRLTRMKTEDWEKLKDKLKFNGLRVVAIDLPTSYQILTPSADQLTSEVMSAVLKGINNLMLDVLAAMASKDYEDRRRRQAEGIAQNKANFRGKQQVQETVDKCLEVDKYIEVNQLSQVKACELAGVSISTWRRFKNRSVSSS